MDSWQTMEKQKVVDGVQETKCKSKCWLVIFSKWPLFGHLGCDMRQNLSQLCKYVCMSNNATSRVHTRIITREL